MLDVVWLREPDEERPANRDGFLKAGRFASGFSQSLATTD